MSVKVQYEDEIFRASLKGLLLCNLKAIISERIGKPSCSLILSYEDTDGDRIMIASDQDLQAAAEELRVLKILCAVRERPASAPSQRITKVETNTETVTRLAALHRELLCGTRKRTDGEVLTRLVGRIAELESSGLSAKGSFFEAMGRLTGAIATDERRKVWP